MAQKRKHKRSPETVAKWKATMAANAARRAKASEDKLIEAAVNLPSSTPFFENYTSNPTPPSNIVLKIGREYHHYSLGPVQPIVYQPAED